MTTSRRTDAARAAHRPADAGFTRGRATVRPADAGFTLLETMLALMLMALVAALALPWAVPGRGGTALFVAAQQIAALMRGDRNAALTLGRPVATLVDIGRGVVAAGAGPGSIAVPPGSALLLKGGEPGRIVFRPDGSSSGGAVGIARGGLAVAVTVNAWTAAVTVPGS